MGNNLTSLLDSEGDGDHQQATEVVETPRKLRSSSQQFDESNYDLVPRLPFELLGVIAKHLVAEDLYGTCATLALCSTSTYAECIPVLYGRFVVWGTKVYQDVLSLLLDRGLLAGLFDQRETRIKAEARKEWEGYKASPMGDYMQYIFVPFPMTGASTSNSVPAKHLQYTPSRGFPKLKASTQISMLPVEGGGLVDMCPSLVVIMLEGFQYGSGDILGLSKALRLLCSNGGPLIEDVFDGPNEITIFPRSAKSVDLLDELDAGLPSIEEAITQLCFLPGQSRGYKPYNVCIRASERTTCQSIALTFLEILFWMKVEGSIEEQPTIVICDVRPETFVACARAYHQATKAEPTLLRVFLKFDLACEMPCPTLVAEMEIIVAIFRAALRSTRSPLALEDLGVLVMIAASRTKTTSWIVYADWHNGKILTTSMIDRVTKVLYEDDWTSEN